MSENTFEIQIKASKRLGYLLVLMHLLALSAVWLANLPMLIQFLLTGLLLLTGVYYWRDILRYSRESELLRYCPLEGWRLSNGYQQPMPIKLQQCFISRPLLIINFRQAGKRHCRLILGDSAEQGALRKLRILLRQTT